MVESEDIPDDAIPADMETAEAMGVEYDESGDYEDERAG